MAKRELDLTAERYRELILSALPVAGDADTVRPQLRTLFTPSSHRNALDPDVTVVRGARGAGKTVWYQALQDDKLRRVASDTYQLPRLRKIESKPGYGSELQPAIYPGPAALSRLVSNGVDYDDIWSAVLMAALGARKEPQQQSWEDRVKWIRENPDEFDLAIANADRLAGKREITTLVLFDALDRLHPDRSTAERLIKGILRLALDLRTRTRNLRAKVFIRHDMFDGTRLQFPDASKLTANAADLTWTPNNLYGLLFHHLGNEGSAMAQAFRLQTGIWRTELDRFVPPADLVGDSKRQQIVFEGIAGEYMGADHRKGRPYTWLPNHLVDGIGQVSPRSFLSALRRATDVTSDRYVRHERALHWDGIRQGVQTASRIRVDEVTEDLPWVAAAVSALEGLQVPIESDVVIERWRSKNLSKKLKEIAVDPIGNEGKVRTGPRYLENLAGLIRELIELGVMSHRADGRIDLPDVYRIAFKIGRRGGIPRLKQ